MLTVAANVSQLLLIAAPIPIFYAINYQQNTTLVDQGLLLNRAIFGWTVPPDLLASVQDLFLLIVIPFFDSSLFPRVALLRDPTSGEHEHSSHRRANKHDNNDNDVDSKSAGGKLIDASTEDG